MRDKKRCQVLMTKITYYMRGQVLLSMISNVDRDLFLNIITKGDKYIWS